MRRVSHEGTVCVGGSVFHLHAAGVIMGLAMAPAWPAHPEWLAKFLQVPGTRIDP